MHNPFAIKHTILIHSRAHGRPTVKSPSLRSNFASIDRNQTPASHPEPHRQQRPSPPQRFWIHFLHRYDWRWFACSLKIYAIQSSCWTQAVSLCLSLSASVKVFQVQQHSRYCRSAAQGFRRETPSVWLCQQNQSCVSWFKCAFFPLSPLLILCISIRN